MIFKIEDFLICQKYTCLTLAACTLIYTLILFLKPQYFGFDIWLGLKVVLVLT